MASLLRAPSGWARLTANAILSSSIGFLSCRHVIVAALAWLHALTFLFVYFAAPMTNAVLRLAAPVSAAGALLSLAYLPSAAMRAAPSSAGVGSCRILATSHEVR